MDHLLQLLGFLVSRLQALRQVPVVLRHLRDYSVPLHEFLFDYLEFRRVSEGVL